MALSSSNQSDPTQSVYSRLGRMLEELMRELVRDMIAQQGLGGEVPFEHVQTPDADAPPLPDFSDVADADSVSDSTEQLDEGLFSPDATEIPLQSGVSPEVSFATEPEIITPQFPEEPSLSTDLAEPQSPASLDVDLGVVDTPISELEAPIGSQEDVEFVTLPVPQPPLIPELPSSVSPTDIPEIAEPEFPLDNIEDLTIPEIIEQLELQPLADIVRRPDNLAQDADIPFPLPANNDARRGFTTDDVDGVGKEQIETLSFVEAQDKYPSTDTIIEMMRKHEDTQRRFLEELERMYQNLVDMFEASNHRVVNFESRLERSRSY